MIRGVARAGGRTFDWNPNHDPRSREYGIRRLAIAAPTKPVWWAGGPVLDQGAEGACAGFAAAGEAAASPIRVKGITDRYAFDWYARAKQLDEFPGVDYEGTSINATMKVGRERGLWAAYHWAFGVEDVKRALLTGPVVIGIPWYESMYETRPDGSVVIGGELVGGHALLVTGWAPSYGRIGETFRWRNSWSKSYGKGGNGYIHARDLARLLEQDGEAAVATQRGYGLAA